MRPETVHLAGQKPSLALIKAEFERRGAGVDHADQWLANALGHLTLRRKIPGKTRKLPVKTPAPVRPIGINLF
jgi:hypothetical protein